MIFDELFRDIEIIEKNVGNGSDITSISSDSRKMKKGSIFVCLKGQKYDGHVWIDSALENGAEFIVCEEKPEKDIPFVQVKDTRKTLPMLLSNFYSHPEKSFETVIGITGTNGKTSTSFMLKKIFDHAGKKSVLLGTTKYLVGDEEYPVDKNEVFLTTPDPELLYAILYEGRKKGCRALIMEVSSHSLYFKKVDMIRYGFGIFTNLTQDHLDFHKTMEEYMKAKRHLFELSDNGIFNMDDPNFERMTENSPAKVTTYSMNTPDADYYAANADFSSPDCVKYTLCHKNEKADVKVGIAGKFTVYNSLSAISCANMAGIPLEECADALSSMTGVKGRIEKIETDKPYSVFIDFAHTPDALINVTKTLREFTKGRLITLFGCGGDRDRTKRPIMGKIALEKSDFVIITSDNSRSEEKDNIIRDILEGARDSDTPFVTIVDRAEAIKYALDHAKEGDTVLLAGKGHEEYEIDKTGKHYFSEREIVQKHACEKQ